ncbi:hypothetical protein [Domibacillus sp.]|uniref:hypothetical protein n=1 Tax=Domibacillus sp. TaxID=1969783 RepID=UPI002810C28C|nr:hypothetical protein [Domibacillus sp.]
MSSLTDKKRFLNKFPALRKQGKQIKAFMSFIDPLVSLAADISRELNHAGLSVKALFNMGNKPRFRGLLKENQASPFYTVCSIEENKDNPIKKYSVHLPFIMNSLCLMALKMFFSFLQRKSLKKRSGISKNASLVCRS